MRRQLEQPTTPPTSSPMELKAKRLAASVRAKIQQGLTLTSEEQVFWDEQRRQDREGDNPRYGN